MLSETDKRVLSYLSAHGPSGAASIGRACFREAGKPRDSGTLPAASHLARMLERGLVERHGAALYKPAVSHGQPDLFGGLV